MSANGTSNELIPEWPCSGTRLPNHVQRHLTLATAHWVRPDCRDWRLRVDDWERMIDVNLKGVLYGIAAVLPVMQRQKSGHVVNVSSVAGHKVHAGGAVYAATKHAVRALSEGLRQEVKPYGIRTTVLSPGVASELTDSIMEQDVAAAMRRVYEHAISPDAFARAVVYAISQPEDVDIWMKAGGREQVAAKLGIVQPARVPEGDRPCKDNPSATSSTTSASAR